MHLSLVMVIKKQQSLIKRGSICAAFAAAESSYGELFKLRYLSVTLMF